MRILHVETGMNLYGGALQVNYLLRGLAEHEGVESILVCPENSAIGEAAREHVKGLYAVPMKGDLDLPFVPRLMSIIRRENPDIVHLHSRRGGDILGGVAAKLSGTPCILTRRVDNPENRLLAMVKYRLYDHVVTISEGIRTVLTGEGVPPGKVTCVHSAVDTSRYGQVCDSDWFRREFGLGGDNLACGVVAQFIDRKGHRFLLRAIPEILKAVPEATFIFFGKGPLEGQLKTMCRELGIEEKVTFAGFRKDLHRILGCLALLIHPALMEGLGVSLLQAAAAGVPIVGVRAGGIPEIVHDGVNGYLVPPSDISAICEKVIDVLQDNHLRRSLGERGREIASESFSIDAMVEGNLAVYRSLTGS